MRARTNGFLAGAAAAMLAAGAASQTPPEPTAKPAATRPAAKIVQPREFLDLAAKARKLKSVWAQGTGRVKTTPPRDLPADQKQVNFTVWAVPPAAKVVLAIGDGETRVSDGTFAYVLRKRPGAKAMGRRRRITPANLYHALDRAAVFCDAAAGYANLAAAVRFIADRPPARFATQFPKLRWFKLAAETNTPHHLLAGAEWVRVGIDPADGLMRVLVASMTKGTGDEKVHVEVSVVYAKVVCGKAAAGDLKLPPDAAKAEWIDADTGKGMLPPAHLIAAAKP